MSAHPVTAKDPETIDDRLGHILSHLLGQVSALRRNHNHDPAAPIVISQDSAEDLILHLDRLGFTPEKRPSCTLPNLHRIFFNGLN